MKFLRFLPALLALLLLSGCLSAAVAKMAGRGREVLKSGTRAEVIEHFGAPLTDVPEWVATKARSDATTYRGDYTVWKVRGRPAASDDGGGQATVSALTLGVGEVIMLPATLLGEGKNALSEYYLIGIFGPDGRIRAHSSYEADAQKK